MSLPRLSYAEYAALDGVNWSSLRELRRSPARYAWRLTHPPIETDAMRLGRATHTAVLEPERFLGEYVLWTKGRRAGKEWDAFEADAAARDVTILKADQYEMCLAMAAAVRGNPVAAPYLAEGEAERAIVWTDEKTGLVCKGRLDWLPPPAVIDLKTTRSIDARLFAADMARFGYACQMGHYCAGLKALTGRDWPAVLIAVEKDPPFEVAVFRLADEALYAGAAEVAELLATLKTCRAAGSFPPRYEAEQVLDLPRWAYPSDDENLATFAAAAAGLMEG